MGAVKRLVEDIYYEYLQDVLSIGQIAEKYNVDERFVLESIDMMSEYED